MDDRQFIVCVVVVTLAAILVAVRHAEPRRAEVCHGEVRRGAEA